MSILKNKNKQKKLSPKSWKYKTNIYANPGLSWSAFKQLGPVPWILFTHTRHEVL